jgi:hypothetical protein
MIVPANCRIATPFCVQVFRDRTLPSGSRSSVGAAAGSHVIDQFGSTAWEIQGRDALKASVKTHAGDQSTTFSRFMPTAIRPVSAAASRRGSQASKPSRCFVRRRLPSRRPRSSHGRLMFAGSRSGPEP